MNYGELKTAIQDYCQSSETTFVNNLNNFIIASEDRVFAAIDMPSRWEDDDNVTLVAGTAEYVLGDSGTDSGLLLEKHKQTLSKLLEVDALGAA